MSTSRVARTNVVPADEAPLVGFVSAEWAVMNQARGPTVRDELWNRTLLAPVVDILGRPGKAFRARLVEACWSLVQPGQPMPPSVPAVVEILHAGSLIVDDIEDGSTERRGAPAVHLLHGIPGALNAANWMYFWALDLLGRLDVPPATAAALQRRAVRTLLDCHRGQALDLGLEVGSVAQRDVPTAVAETTALKTGALMELAAALGVAAAGGTQAQIDSAARFGLRLGVALQKLDDLGNLTSERAPGKRHEDLRTGRLTWPWAWAAETLDELSFAWLESASRGLRAGVAQGRHDVEADAVVLAERLRLCAGAHRRRQIRAELERALADLELDFGPSPVSAAIAAEIARLEESYG